MSTEEPKWRRMRSHAEITYMLDWITKNPSPSGPVWMRGALETLRWVLGQQEAAPVTGRKVGYPVRYAVVGNEAYEATTAMYNGGHAKVGQLPQVFLQGVESMAMWITGSDTVLTTDDWPFPDDAPQATPDGYAADTDTRQLR